MTDHAHELRRHAYKIGRPAGDTPAVMHAAAAHIEDLERELRAAEIRLHDVATHCATVEAELAEIKRRTCVAVTCNHVARMERAEWEKQEPVAWMNEQNGFICKDPKNADFCVPIYAAPPSPLRWNVTSPPCATSHGRPRVIWTASMPQNEQSGRWAPAAPAEDSTHEG